MSVQLQKKYVLGEFELEPRKYLLRHHDQNVHLPELPFRVLVYLIEHRDRYVSRQELLEHFWEGSDSYEETLTRCISTIRTQLNDPANDSYFIETRKKVGYRYIGPFEEEAVQFQATGLEIERTRGVKVVVEEDYEPNSEFANERAVTAPEATELQREGARRRSWLQHAILGSAAIIIAASAFLVYRTHSSATTASAPAPIHSIAVLPLKDLSGDSANEYFSDGMTESLITALSKIDSLKVISCSSVVSFKGKEVDPREVGQRLNVAAVLEGGVRKDAESVRLAVRLVSTDDRRVLWTSETYDRKMEDIFGLQDEIARGVVAG